MEIKGLDQQEVRSIAAGLVIGITKKMSGLSLVRCPCLQEQRRGRRLESVYGAVEGELRLRMRFEAEPGMVSRMAEGLFGEPPESRQELEEYATEYVNVLCGRFVSELCRDLHPKLRFQTPRYELPPALSPLGEEQGIETLCFMSERQELAVFSWAIG